MPKQTININFSQGVDTKTDPFQIPIGKFSNLQNSIFTKGNRLGKRNGYKKLLTPNEVPNFITTFNSALTAIGSTLEGYSDSSQTWTTEGFFKHLDLSVLSLIRNNLNQTQVDCAISSNGSVCTVYSESNGSTTSYKYVVADSVTGQNTVAPTALSDAISGGGGPRVFFLNPYFIVLYTATSNHLKYIAISALNPTAVTAPADVTTGAYGLSTTCSFDAAVLNSSLYIAWNSVSSGGIKMASLTSTLNISSTHTIDASHTATLMSVCTDTVNGVIWASYFDSGTTNGYSFVVDQNLNVVHNAVAMISSVAVANLASTAVSGIMTLLYEVTNAYSYDSGIPTNFIRKRTLTQSGTAGTAVTIIRSVGLASKSFMIDDSIYFLCAYSSPFQSTYFISDDSGNIIFKLAYQNAGGYLKTGLPSVSVSGEIFKVPYLIKDLIEAVNKDTNPPSGTQVSGIYSQTGINLASSVLSGFPISAEIGTNLNITGGITWAYDGYSVTEQGFHLYPDSVEETATATTGGFMIPQQYFYQVTYEWSDNQGNLFRSAPSIPISFTVPAGTNTNTVTLSIPTLRLTSKISNPVKIVIYRWSTAQQTYYQTTSISSPLLNDPTIDSVTFVDKNSDPTILGNNILYTTGGVLENIGPPSFKSVFLFDDRLWGITSEDPNLLWLSKQVIESTPVEMSDLQTLYIAPNTGAQGPSGELTCGFPMDDKAILFKESSILYFNGTGPDITGANNQYSQPILITSTLGCTNQNSIVCMPDGLMFEFQSEAGNQIWLLGRDLSTRDNYIGAAVEGYTQNATVLSAVNIPGTNQVRFTMSSGITLMYDYYYRQWGTFVNVPAISSCLYQGLHTYVDSFGRVFQESPGSYVDGSNPVLLSFKTGWINLAGLQGYERLYEFLMLANYLSPHFLSVQVAFDYNSSPLQSKLIQPTNFSSSVPSPFGIPVPVGAPTSLEQWRFQTKKQKTQAFQITVTEVFNPTLGTMPGAGFTMSGITCEVLMKKGYRPISAANTTG